MKKSIFVLFSLMLSVAAATAQEAVGCKAERDMHLQDNLVPTKDYVYQHGDTIIITKETEHYLTGEEPSTWVYYVRHIVEHQGGKRFPNGVLIDGIMSWVAPEALCLTGATEKTEEALAKEQQDRKRVQQLAEDLAKMSEDERQALAREAAKHNAELVEGAKEETKAEEPAKEEPAVVAEEPAKEEVAAAEEPAKEEAAEEEKAEKTQFDRFTIGVRGGTASLMHDAPEMGNWKAGFDALLDLQYAHYWVNEKKDAYGILTGLSAGYSRSGLANAVDYKDVANAGATDEIDYHITASKLSEKDGQVQLEIPVMFSMVMDNGFFLNAGPRFVIPVYAHYDQKVSDDVHVEAEFPHYGVSVDNLAATGVLTDNTDKGKWNGSKLNLMLSAELGYEFKLNSGNSLGLGVYANYSVYTLYKNDPTGKDLMDITAPTTSAPGVIDMQNATSSFLKDGGLGYFDAGVKLAYHFNFFKK